MVVQRGGHTGLGSSSHGSDGEGLGFLFGECGFNGVKITTLVILTKVENAKVLTKTFTRRFYFFSFLSQSLNKDFSSHRCHQFDVGATFEMRETNSEKSIFRLIMIAAAQRLINGRR